MKPNLERIILRDKYKLKIINYRKYLHVWFKSFNFGNQTKKQVAFMFIKNIYG